MREYLKTKEVILIALLAALFIVITMAFAIPLSIMGGLIGHQIASTLSILVTGSIYYFIARKVGKFGQFIIFNGIFMLVFLISSGGHFGAIIASMIGAIIADYIASRSKDTPTLKIAIGVGIIHTSMLAGIIIPNIIYVEKLTARLAAKGYSQERVVTMVEQATGPFAYVLLVVSFFFAMAGVYIGARILKKHFESVAA